LSVALSQKELAVLLLRCGGCLQVNQEVPMVSTVWTEQKYRLPELLSDIRLLDLLELSGTTVRASQLLNLSQPTVSRRYRALADDFGLRRDPRSIKRCRYGSTNAMRLLRLGCRAHRLGAGVARIGTDLLHWHLLEGCDWLLPVPVQFRPACEWAELVRQGVLDGAVVSGLELNANPEVDVTGLRLLELGRITLALGVNNESPPRRPSQPSAVLVPHRGLAPGLHRALFNRGLKLRSVGSSCVTPQHWLRRLADGATAIPLDPACCAPDSWAEGLVSIPMASEPQCPVWLVLPKGDGLPGVLTQTLEALQRHSSFSAQGAG
jgi:DNA-binding transcriptional LysR family regulator